MYVSISNATLWWEMGSSIAYIVWFVCNCIEVGMVDCHLCNCIVMQCIWLRWPRNIWFLWYFSYHLIQTRCWKLIQTSLILFRSILLLFSLIFPLAWFFHVIRLLMDHFLHFFDKIFYRSRYDGCLLEMMNSNHSRSNFVPHYSFTYSSLSLRPLSLYFSPFYPSSLSLSLPLKSTVYIETSLWATERPMNCVYCSKRTQNISPSDHCEPTSFLVLL